MPDDNDQSYSPAPDQQVNYPQNTTPTPDSRIRETETTPSPSTEPAIDENRPVAPATYSELESTERVPMPMTIPPVRKSRKKLIVGLVIAGIVVVLGASTALGYNLWYQNPNKVLADAAQNLISSDSVNYDGVLRTTNGEDKLRGTFKGAFVDARSKFSTDLTAESDGELYEFGAAAIIDKNSMIFFKVENVDSILGILTDGADTSMYDNVIAIVNDQWIRIDEDDDQDESIADEQVCMAEALTAASKDGAKSEEIEILYRNNQIIEVKDKLAVKTINGIESIGYEVGIDLKAIKSFTKDLNDTELAKNMRKCDSEFKFDAESIESDSEFIDKSKIDVYVSRWSHELTQVLVNGKDDETTWDIAVEPIFNKPVKIDPPAESKTFEELMRAIEEAFMTSYEFEEA